MSPRRSLPARERTFGCHGRPPIGSYHQLSHHLLSFSPRSKSCYLTENLLSCGYRYCARVLGVRSQRLSESPMTRWRKPVLNVRGSSPMFKEKAADLSRSALLKDETPHRRLPERNRRPLSPRSCPQSRPAGRTARKEDTWRRFARAPASSPLPAVAGLEAANFVN